MPRSMRFLVLLILLVGAFTLGSGCVGTTAPNTTTPATTVPTTTPLGTVTTVATATIVGNVTTVATTPVPANQTNCTSNEDCIAAQCCHPWGCVNRTFAPNCTGVFCTLSCEGPIDCGAGHCGCVNGTCAVIPGPAPNATATLTGTPTTVRTTTAGGY